MEQGEGRKRDKGKGWRGGGGEGTGIQEVARGNQDLPWTHSVTSTYQPPLPLNTDDD